MKLEIGMYVRTKKLGIKKIYEIDNNKTKYKYLYKLKNQDGDGCIDLGVLCEDDIVGEPSFDIIDLIEKGDYINGKEVYSIGLTIGILNTINFFDGTVIVVEDIKSIVTKEQFEQMSYEVSE